MEILRGLEASPRGAYCGALGWFAPDGSAAFNVSIRTLTISGDSRSGQRGELGIGGGVVQDSQEDEEYAECLLKARFYATGRPPRSLIETLRWEENGFVRRDAHLARMAASAVVFGLAFDATAAHAALTTAVADAQAVLPPACVSTHEGEVAVAGRPLAAVACESRRGALRVRLTLDESGRFAAQAHTLAPDPPHWTFTVSPRRINSTDALLRHKTDWRDLYEQAVAEAGTDEVVFVNERGEVCEGARSTVFVERDGVLLTPPVSCGLLPGVLRAELLATGRAREAVLMPGDLKENVWFGNSLRGLIGGVAVL
jgi:para-aminobenzoate synthetase/4-amino-4-deoxychorismate lyase